MSRVSRRDFLRHASLSTAAVGVAVAVPGFLRSGNTATPTAPDASARTAKLDQEGPLVAHIDDASTGAMTLMMGKREVQYRNQEIARQLLGAAQ